jgi:leucyl aminopeptidase
MPQFRRPFSLNPFSTNSDQLNIQTKPIQETILHELTQDDIITSIQSLSGDIPVNINGTETYLKSRYSYAMFLDYPEADVLPYLLEQVAPYVSADQIEIDPYTYTDAEQPYTWQNLIVRFPGKTTPEEKILLTAHFDSIVVRGGDALQYAPGADDNGTGTTVLLQAVRFLSAQPFEKSIDIIFFSGEEEGLNGSKAYLEDHPTENIVAVINVDMIGYDSNSDSCMEIHAGTNENSQNIALALSQVNLQYNLGLQTEILTTNATDRSDHASFWAKNIPAVLLIENFFDTATSDLCHTADPNPYYHQTTDTIENINIDYVQRITQMVLITTSELAIPIK